MFQHIESYAGDPILSLMEAFKLDARTDKVNLSIGLYYDERGIIPQLQTVQQAQARLEALPPSPSLYLPMEGMLPYRQAIQKLLLSLIHI